MISYIEFITELEGYCWSTSLDAVFVTHEGGTTWTEVFTFENSNETIAKVALTDGKILIFGRYGSVAWSE